MTGIAKGIAALALAAAGCSLGPPQRDFFLPPYAEKGCWAQLYEETGFAGASRVLEGPLMVEALSGSLVWVPDLETIPPQPLFSEVRSLRIGPHARIEGYGETLFRAPTLALPAGAAIADLAAIEFHQRVRSFRMQCEA